MKIKFLPILLLTVLFTSCKKHQLASTTGCKIASIIDSTYGIYEPEKLYVIKYELIYDNSGKLNKLLMAGLSETERDFSYANNYIYIMTTHTDHRQYNDTTILNNNGLIDSTIITDPLQGRIINKYNYDSTGRIISVISGVVDYNTGVLTNIDSSQFIWLNGNMIRSNSMSYVYTNNTEQAADYTLLINQYLVMGAYYYKSKNLLDMGGTYSFDDNGNVIEMYRVDPTRGYQDLRYTYICK
jgi:hypothetical protein